MKILVATKEMQGKRKNDFSFCEENEPVMFGLECDGESVDGGCGCRRSLVGIDSRKATTTFKVVDLPINKIRYAQKLMDSVVSAGFYEKRSPIDKSIYVQAKDLYDLACHFDGCGVLEKRGNKIQVRV